MHTNLSRSAILSLSLLASCGGPPADAAAAAEARALLAQIQAHTGIGGAPHGEDWQLVLKRPRPAGRSADSVDPMTLVTEAEVAAILRRRGAAGDGTATATFVVTKERIAVRAADGHGSAVCKVWWRAKDRDGATGAQGNFELAILDMTAFGLIAALFDARLPDLGDEAVDAHGIPYVRQGDLAVTVSNTTSTNGMSRDVLAVAAPRLK